MTLNQPDKDSLADAATQNLFNLFKILNTSEEIRTKFANALLNEGENTPEDCIAYLENLKGMLDCVIETLDLKVGT